MKSLGISRIANKCSDIFKLQPFFVEFSITFEFYFDLPDKPTQIESSTHPSYFRSREPQKENSVGTEKRSELLNE